MTGKERRFPSKPRALGAHYSPRPLVDSLVEASLGPLLAEGRFEPEDPPLVIDPACGDGVFLASAATRIATWIASERPHASGSWVAGQALGAVHGVDLDPVAVRGARAVLVAALGRWDQELDAAAATSQVVWGNALLGPGEAAASLRPLDLEAAFSGARPGGRFDLVVGNPPFVDAEEMTRSSPALRKALVARYRAARGNWDLFCPFVERALELTASDGALGLILPNKLLSARYAAETRRILCEQDVLLLRDCASLRLFDAAVYPLLLVARRRAPAGPCRVERGTGDQRVAGSVSLGTVTREELGRLAGAGWGALLTPLSGGRGVRGTRGGGIASARLARRAEGRDARPAHRPLGELCEVRGAATVAEAYALVPLIRDGDPPMGAFRLVNTGLVDPFRDLWGERPLRYLGRSYMRPWVASEALHELQPRRAAQARSSKIIVAGLSRSLECAWDEGGLLAGKSTSVILPLDEGKFDLEWILALLALLSCEAVSMAFRRQFAGLTLASGYLRVGPPQLRALAVPDPGALPSLERRALADLSRGLVALGKAGAAPQEPAWREAISELGERTWGLFGLAPPLD